ncbi:hypothetical protein C8Q79DRAFT_1007636 [Trametes meyenii]|nr:hypothetical protein C8Q79DRAFT_1007636 [Trametes meyenii]
MEYFGKKLLGGLKDLSCFVASSANDPLGSAHKSWRALHSADADLEAGRLIPRTSSADKALRIVIMLPSDEEIALEASGPASAYSELDSPTVETPILDSPVVVQVYEGAFDSECASSLVTDQVGAHFEMNTSNAFVEPSKDFFIAAYGFGSDSYTEQQEKSDRLIGAFAMLLSSERLSDCIEDDGDDGTEEPYEARFDGITKYLAEVQPALKYTDSCAAIVHRWYGLSPPSEPQLAPEYGLEGLEGDSSYLEAETSFYSCPESSFVEDPDGDQLVCDFALSPAASGEVYYDCYG